MIGYNQIMSTVLLIILFAFILNIPFGYFRSRSKKYSLKWFIYIHMPVPIVVIARLISHTDYKFIPLFIMAAVIGQFFGGKLEFN
ncbi:MAG: hypothetical protein M1610_00740 [Nitrospirae bacterium]|nr:hypothetical protein [Nitrospirota bacterium]MDA8215905.1 hypothetical protein [Nitrospiraceae bacterium]